MQNLSYSLLKIMLSENGQIREFSILILDSNRSKMFIFVILITKCAFHWDFAYVYYTNNCIALLFPRSFFQNIKKNISNKFYSFFQCEQTENILNCQIIHN